MEPTAEDLQQQMAHLLDLLQKATTSEKDAGVQNELRQLEVSLREAEQAFFPAFNQELARAEAQLAESQARLQAATAAAAAVPKPPVPIAAAGEFVPLPGARLREEVLHRFAKPKEQEQKPKPLSEESVGGMTSEAWQEGAKTAGRSRPPRPVPQKPARPLPRPASESKPAPPSKPSTHDSSSDIGENDLSELFHSEGESSEE